MVSSLEKELLTTLTALDLAAKSMATARPKPDLLALFSQVDQLAGQLPRQTDPVLLHYLHQKSYAKARLFLQGREAENQAGNCRPE